MCAYVSVNVYVDVHIHIYVYRYVYEKNKCSPFCVCPAPLLRQCRCQLAQAAGDHRQPQLAPALSPHFLKVQDPKQQGFDLEDRTRLFCLEPSQLKGTEAVTQGTSPRYSYDILGHYSLEWSCVQYRSLTTRLWSVRSLNEHHWSI